MALMDEAVWRGKIYSGMLADVAAQMPAHGEPGRVHRYPLGHHPRRHRPVPVLA
jgi:hypothetical protein